MLQTGVKGLLVVELENGEMAGMASQMNATAVEISAESDFEVGFNQKVGKMMKGATDEVKKFILVRHAGKPLKGLRIELAFADKYTPKDGPSAAVACALMADSILSGDKLDDGFATTGDMTATGEVRPVGGVRSKIGGAIRKDCTHIAIPEANRNEVSDLYLLEGIESLYKIQVYSISTFEEAKKLATQKHDKDVQAAMDEFEQVQKALERNESYAYNSKVIEKLQNVIKLTPNNLSAKMLLLHGQRRPPKKLSLYGSLCGIDKAGEALGSMLNDGSYQDTEGNNDVLSKFIGEMQRLRPILDARTNNYADSYIKLATYIKAIRGTRNWKSSMDRDLKKHVRNMQNARKQLLNDKEIREELMD